MIELFKDFVLFLSDKGVAVPEIQFPPVPVSNTFEHFFMENLFFILDKRHFRLDRIYRIPSALTDEEVVPKLEGFRLADYM